MAEKRRLSTRERREPAAKRRVSEATTRAPSPAQQTAKRKASTPAVAPSPASTLNPPVETVEPPLPTKIKDGEPLPTLPSAPSTDLSLKEYQSIAESAVLLASLERSKKKWLSDGILERYWTKPKKTKRDQIEGKNPPKESMSKIGPCNIVVGPHLFDAMLYTVKDPNAPPPVQYTPTQRPMVHYGHPNNFQQYHPYPQAPQSGPNQRPNPPQASHSTPPQQSYRPPPPQPARTPNTQTPRRPSVPQPTQRPTASQNPPPQPPKPNPDPVIQMLATRAAQDPELKALMRLVASTNATQEQLRTFQAHIDELNAIIRAREQQQRRQQQQQPSQPSTPTPAQPVAQVPQQPPPTTPQQKPPQQEQQTSTTQAQQQKSPQSRPRVEVQVPKAPRSNATPQNPSANSPKSQPSASQPTPTTSQVKQEPGVATTTQTPAPRVSSPSVGAGSHQSPTTQPMPPPPQQQQAMGQRQGPQYQYQQPPYQGQPIQSRPPQYGSPTPYYRATPPRPPPAPRLNYKSVVFEFTSPLTPYGSSTSGHAGSGDRYLFPEYTILEWLSGGTTVLASFLLVRKVDPNTPFPIETAPDTAPSRAKGKSAPKSKKGDKKKNKAGEAQEDKDKAKDGDANADKGDNNPQSSENKVSATDSKQGVQDGQDDQMTPQATDSNKTAPEIKAGDDKKPSNLKEYYQPITFRIFTSNPKVLEPLARVVKPQDEVRKYMNEIMDRAERAPDGFLAYQLPREQPIEDNESENDNKKGGTPISGSLVNGRSKLSRGRAVGEESDAENTDRPIEEEEEEEELKDFYGPPTGLVPLGI